MITDSHSHFWAHQYMRPPWTTSLWRTATAASKHDQHEVTVASYRAGIEPAERAVVFGLQAQAAGIMVPNDAVAAFARELGPSVVGFMSVDPTLDGSADEVERCAGELGLKGVKLGPIYQGTSPLDPRMLRIFERANALGLPVMIHQGAIFANAGRLSDANPLLLDDVALAFPDLRIVIAHLGHPWVHETAVVMRRHPNVFADISAIARRPSMLAMGLAAAKEYGVLDRVLFGSDFPFFTAQETIERTTRVVEAMGRASLTVITEGELDAILHRPTFDLLELEGD
jgi:predicted TIM-barrel fold metal-dependent hydrolase